MTFRLSIMEKTGTFPNETIHIMPGGVMHLHGNWNKMVPLMKPLYLRILTMALSFIVTLIGQLMTLEAIVFHIGSITTTLATKT
jgi:hypothetical protein